MSRPEKTRFRLNLEQGACIVTMLLGASALDFAPLIGIIVFAPSALYLQRINSKLKTRREPFTLKQRHILFGILVAFMGLFVIGLLLAALLRQTPLLWAVFGLTLIIAVASLVSARNELYKDDKPA